ncbi:hypothetical protein G6F61_014531 [Rhizopus arrhizus]|nr:hypothetical protein G6F61_014531 [Rhizopus arrhizus]
MQLQQRRQALVGGLRYPVHATGQQHLVGAVTQAVQAQGHVQRGVGDAGPALGQLEAALVRFVLGLVPGSVGASVAPRVPLAGAIAAFEIDREGLRLEAATEQVGSAVVQGQRARALSSPRSS